MAWDSAKSRQARGYGAKWDKIRKWILARDKGLCQPCLRRRRITQATEVNHVVPKAKGGSDDDDNLESICNPCHKDETQRQLGRTVKPTFGLDGWPED